MSNMVDLKTPSVPAPPGVKPGQSKSDRVKAFIDNLWSDQTYLDAISQYNNESWYSQLLENPYMRSKQADFKTDPLTEMFNWQGAAASYYGDMRTNAMDWLSKKLQMMHEQEYNSAPEQVARERAAGLNPDLNGNVSAGNAAENDMSVPPAAMRNGTSETGLQIAQAGMQFISSVLSFGKELQSLNIGASNIISSELGAGLSARNFALNEIAGIVGKDINKDSVSDALSVLVSKPRIFSGYSRRTRKFLEHFINRYYNGDSLAVESLVSELRNNVVSNNKSTAEIASSPYFDNDLNKWIGNIGENLSNYISLAESYFAQVAASKGKIESAEWNRKDNQNMFAEGISAGLEADYESKSSVAQSAKYRKELENAWNQLEKVVKGDGSHWYNTIGLILLNFLRMQVSQPLHMGFSSSSSVSDSYGRNGNSHSGSHSSGFHF